MDRLTVLLVSGALLGSVVVYGGLLLRPNDGLARYEAARAADATMRAWAALTDGVDAEIHPDSHT